MRNYIKWHQQTTQTINNASVVTRGPELYYLILEGLDAATNLQVFNALTDAQKLAQSTNVEPGSTTGWQPKGTYQTVVAPDWITAFRYSYTGSLLTFEGQGNIGKLMLNRIDGTSFTTNNPNGVSISNGVFYDYGPDDGQAPYDRQWMINYTGSPLKITLQKANSTETFDYTLTPVSGASKVIITGGNTSSTIVPGWLGSVIYTYDGTTLKIETSGTIAQLSFDTNPQTSWTINNPTGVAITNGNFYGYGPETNGVYTRQWQINHPPATFTVIAQQDGNPSNTYTMNFTPASNAAGVVLVNSPISTGSSGSTGSNGGSSGMSSAQLVNLGLNGDYTAPADQGWNIVTTREKYLENSTLKVGFLRAGAVISFAALQSNSRNLVNSNQVYYNDDPSDFRYNTTTDDVGRQIMFFSDYCSPSPNDNSGQGLIFKNGKKTSTGYKGTVFNTGANVVQGGSMQPAVDLTPILASAVYVHPTRGTEFYAKMRPLVWGVKNEPGWIVGEQWISFVRPNTIHYFIRRTIEVRDPARFDEQRTFGSQSQENPCMYVIAPLIQKLIDLPGESRKNIYNGIGFSNIYYTSTCKIGAYEGDGGTGVTAYSPKNSMVRSMQVLSTDGDWSSNASSYIEICPDRNYDNPGIYEDEGYIIFGTEQEAISAIASLPGIDQSFDFDFTKENMLWANYNSRLIKESAGWTLYLDPHTDNGHTGYSAKLMSPARAWLASSITALNLEVAVTNATSLNFEWQTPGPAGNDSYQHNFQFSVPNPDGQFHIITVPTAHDNFNGIISSMGFSSTDSGTSANAKVVIKRIWKS